MTQRRIIRAVTADNEVTDFDPTEAAADPFVVAIYNFLQSGQVGHSVTLDFDSEGHQITYEVVA